MIGSNPRASFFCSSNWANVLRESYSYRPLYFALPGSTPAATAFIPVMEINSQITGKRGVSLPFSDYCDPVAPDRNRFLELFDEVIGYGRRAGWKYFEMRGGRDFLDSKTPAFSTYFGHTIDLSMNEDALFSSFRSSTRQRIRKASRLGIKADVFTTAESVDEYYRLHCLTRKMHGLPPQPHSFFRKIHQNAIEKGHGIVVLGNYQKKWISGAICLHFGDKAIYKYGASDPQFKHLNLNHPTLWESIRWYSARGLSGLSLGRTDLDNTGLSEFKMGYRPRQYRIEYFRFDFKHMDFIEDNPKKNNMHEVVLRKMPLALLKLAGRLLYKHQG